MPFEATSRCTPPAWAGGGRLAGSPPAVRRGRVNRLRPQALRQQPTWCGLEGLAKRRPYKPQGDSPVKSILAALVAFTFGIGAAFAADDMSKDSAKTDKPAASKKKASKAKAKRAARRQEVK